MQLRILFLIACFSLPVYSANTIKKDFDGSPLTYEEMQDCWRNNHKRITSQKSYNSEEKSYDNYVLNKLSAAIDQASQQWQHESKKAHLVTHRTARLKAIPVLKQESIRKKQNKKTKKKNGNFDFEAFNAQYAAKDEAARKQIAEEAKKVAETTINAEVKQITAFLLTNDFESAQRHITTLRKFDSKKATSMTALKNERYENSITRLIKDMSSLSDGDNGIPPKYFKQALEYIEKIEKAPAPVNDYEKKHLSRLTKIKQGLIEDINSKKPKAHEKTEAKYREENKHIIKDIKLLSRFRDTLIKENEKKPLINQWADEVFGNNKDDSSGPNDFNFADDEEDSFDDVEEEEEEEEQEESSSTDTEELKKNNSKIATLLESPKKRKFEERVILKGKRKDERAKTTKN